MRKKANVKICIVCILLWKRIFSFLINPLVKARPQRAILQIVIPLRQYVLLGVVILLSRLSWFPNLFKRRIPTRIKRALLL